MHNGHLTTRELNNNNSTNGSLAIYDQEFALVKEFRLPFLPHSNFQNSWNLNLLVATPDSGNKAALINLKNDEIKLISLNDGMQFTGHGFFIPQSSNFALTAIDSTTEEGEIIYFDQFGTIQRKHSSHGFNPHQLDVDLQDPTMAIAVNRGKAPFYEDSSLTWFKINDGVVAKKLVTQKSGESLKHFTQTKDNNTYVYGEELRLNKSSPLLYLYQSRFEKTASHWIKMSRDWNLSGDGQILNILLDPEYERLWMTLPDKGFILIFNPITNLIEKKFERKKARLLLPLLKSDKIYVTCDPLENNRYFSRSKKEGLSLQSNYFKLDYLGQHLTVFKRPTFSL